MSAIVLDISYVENSKIRACALGSSLAILSSLGFLTTTCVCSQTHIAMVSIGSKPISMSNNIACCIQMIAPARFCIIVALQVGFHFQTQILYPIHQGHFRPVHSDRYHHDEHNYSPLRKDTVVGKIGLYPLFPSLIMTHIFAQHLPEPYTRHIPRQFPPSPPRPQAHHNAGRNLLPPNNRRFLQSVRPVLFQKSLQVLQRAQDQVTAKTALLQDYGLLPGPPKEASGTIPNVPSMQGSGRPQAQ